MKAIARAFALVAMVAIASARVVTVDPPGVALDAPDDWKDSPEIASVVRPPREFIAGITSPDGKRSFVAFCDRVKESETADYTKALLNELAREGFTIGPKEAVAIHGVDFDSYTGAPADASAPVLQFFSTFVNGRAFALSINNPAEDPTKDAELQAIVQSFRFLAPPKPFSGKTGSHRPGNETIQKFSKLSLLIGLLICPAVLVIGFLVLLRKKR